MKKNKNKTYAGHLTRHEQRKRSQIAVFIFTIIGAMIVGSNSLLEAYAIDTVAVKHAVRPKIAITEILTDKPDIETQIREIAKQRAFKWEDYLVRLALCESRLNPEALGDSGKSRGLFQIHKGYHPEVSDEQAFDIAWATNWTIDKINAGQQGLWSCDKIVKNNKNYLVKK